MNVLKYCMLSTILASAAFAQEPGFFVSISGGTSQMKAGNFAVYNPVASIPGQPLGEALPAVDRKDSVTVSRLTFGYTVNQSWDFRFSYANYGTGEVQMAFPLYPGMVFITAPDPYTRHALVYKTSVLTFMPCYNYALSEKMKLRVGAGVNYGMTDSHFEDARRANITGVPRSNSYAKSSDTSLSYLLSLGADYKVTEKLSVGLSANYTTMKADIPSSPWANRTKTNVQISSLSTELALSWHW